jgi:hypothetical protein
LDKDPNAYQIQNAITSIKTRLSKDEKATRSKEYLYTYVVHYDSEKYDRQKREYESGVRKSRPNGHRSYYIPVSGRIKRKRKKKAPITYELDKLYDSQPDRFKSGRYQGVYEF